LRELGDVNGPAIRKIDQAAILGINFNCSHEAFLLVEEAYDLAVAMV